MQIRATKQSNGSLINSGEAERKSRGQTNLKPFPKGVSGNPKGRPPKHDTFTSLLKEEIEKQCPDDASGKTWKECLVIATLKLAIKGNATALKELWDRVDGKVPLRMNEEQGPVEIVVRYDR